MLISRNKIRISYKKTSIKSNNFAKHQIFIFCPFSTAAQIKKIANAEIHEPPKFDNDTYNYPTTIATDQEPIKIIPKSNITTTYELRKCLSGDETLMLSAAENPDLLSGNETLVNLPNNEDGEASDEEIEDIEMEDDNNDIGKDDVLKKKRLEPNRKNSVKPT